MFDQLTLMNLLNNLYLMIVKITSDVNKVDASRYEGEHIN